MSATKRKARSAPYGTRKEMREQYNSLEALAERLETEGQVKTAANVRRKMLELKERIRAQHGWNGYKDRSRG